MAIALDDEIDGLAVGVAGEQALAQDDPQVAGQRGVGIVDGLVLAHQAAELGAVGPRVGASLTPENVALPGLRFTTAFMLSYVDAPLAVIAYVDPSGAPVLLCILANRAPAAPMRSERRGDLSLAWWSGSGRTHLVIGRIPKEKAVALAQMLEKRV